MEIETQEYDCFICKEKHATGDRRWFRHMTYIKGVVHTHVHDFIRSEGAVMAACFCGAQKIV